MNATDALPLAADTLPHVLISAPAAPLAGPFEIWTDGGCRPNPGTGGFAAIIRDAASQERMLSGAERNSTNNRAELHAAILALEALEGPSRATIHVDSEHVFLGITARAANWEAQGWKTNKGKPVANVELWRRLVASTEGHDLTWRWVRGHGTDMNNWRVDAAATEAREQAERRLRIID